MSRYQEPDPTCTPQSGLIAKTITPKSKDLGGFSVRRVLPAPGQRMIGPFIFFDHIGPARFPSGEGIQVRPHPHIGLATVTYLFDGQLVHRDSLGFTQTIRPGAVNWMVAGRGIVHSERSGDDLSAASSLHGIQIWVALPEDQQECDPAFIHYPATEIPEIALDDAQVRVILGDAFDLRSPVATLSDTLYLECRMRAGARLAPPGGHQELGVYLVDGEARIGDEPLSPGTMALLGDIAATEIIADSDARVLMIGGAPLGERHIWWNFVATRRERIEQAKSDWQNGRFEPVPGDQEFIPLPD